MNLRWKIAQAAEIKWWRRYLGKKDKDEYLNWKRNYWHQFLERTGLEIKNGAQILDAGCGPAGIFTILSQYNVTAIDPLLDSYEQQLTHFEIAEYPWVDFIKSPLESFERANTFDIIFCLNAINHVADIDLAMDQLIKLLRPGGTLVLSIDAHNYWWLKSIFRLLPGDILHPHQYDLEDYKLMLEKRNCEINTSYLQKKEWIFNYYVLVATK